MRNVVKFDAFSPSLAVASLCVGLAFVPEWVAQNLEWNRGAVDSGELWRLWTGHVVHYSPRHALFDAAALALLGWMAEAHFGKRLVAAAVLCGASVMSAALWMFTNIAEYRGASGLATLTGTMLGLAAWQQKPAQRKLLMVLLWTFLTKVACDAFGLSLTLTHLPLDVRIAWQIHLLGMVLAATMFAPSLQGQHESGSKDHRVIDLGAPHEGEVFIPAWNVERRRGT